MLGLFGLTAMEETRPLSLAPPSEIGLGPIGLHAVPMRLMATPPTFPCFCLLQPGPVFRPWAAARRSRAVASTPREPWRRLRASPARLPRGGARQSADAPGDRGPSAGDAGAPDLPNARAHPRAVPDCGRCALLFPGVPALHARCLGLVLP